MIGLDVRGLVELQRKGAQVIEDLHGKPMLDGMRRVTVKVATDAKKLTPVDQNRLRSSITPDVIPQGMEVLGIVGTNVLYGPYMELGTRPHWPPISALEVWARRHGMNPYLVARAIAQHGTKPRRFMQGAFEQNEDYIRREIGDVVGEIVQK